MSTWQSSRVRIRPVQNTDIKFLYETSTDPEILYRWRYRGSIPDATEFTNSLTSGVLIQFIVEKRATGHPIGLVTAYNANQRDGFVYVGALSSTRYFMTGLVLDGVALLIDYLFDVWPFRKIYTESIEFNSNDFSSAFEGILHEEGRLRDHTFHSDRYWDLITSAIYRADWLKLRKSGLNRVDVSGEAGYFEAAVRLEENTSMTLDEFCKLLEATIPSPSGITRFDPDHRLLEDLGFDSLSTVEMAAAIDELAGGVVMDWPDRIGTVRDAYLWYTTAASLPKVSGS